ncbi:hypothetical protein [Solimonas marina]|uniref:DUF3108 domain-containing protein n=1 Tax=Solimonas marina TaxID=2714601 RepID=A0A969WC66_9GAMM|nr:hypothetical protein [Solimonas marina]NKF23849.1 hypothetical protein [Solimonas marina]
MTRLAAAAGAALLLICSSAAWAETLKFYGYAYDLKSGRYLYTEVHHEQVDHGHWLGGTIRYYAPDGTLIGDKTLKFDQDPYVPVYDFDMKTDGYHEAITSVSKDGIAMEKRSTRDDPLKKKTIEHAQPMCADSGFHALLVANFATLMAHKTFTFTFGVAGNLASYRFRAKRIGDTTFEGKPAVRFRVEPDSLLRWFVDPLVVTYDPETKKLLEYEGVSNIPNPATNKPYVARIAYYSQPPKDVPTLPPLDP